RAVQKAGAMPAAGPRHETGGKPIRRGKGREDARKRGGRADREVDAAGQDDEAHSERNQCKHGIVTQEREDIVESEKVVVTQGAEQNEEQERDEDALLHGGAEGALMKRIDRRFGCHKGHALPLRRCSHTAAMMMAAFTTKAAESGTPLASSV